MELFGMDTVAEMRALWWKQPYGTLMLPPYDKWETRSWSTSYRGLVLICTSQAPYTSDERLKISGGHITRIKADIKDGGPEYSEYMFGYAIGVGRLKHCRRMQYNDEGRTYCLYNPASYVHLYTEVQRIKPIKLKDYNFEGVQKWKTVTEKLRAAIEYYPPNPY